MSTSTSHAVRHATDVLIIGFALTLHLLALQTACAQAARWFISPGVKMSYAFGEPSGFTFGWELSVYRTIVWKPSGDEEGFVGAVFDIDWCKSRTKLHAGIEGSQRLVGFSIGPTLVLQDGERCWGGTVTVYSWFAAMPYYAYTYVHEACDVHEAGAYVKIPIQLNGASFWKFSVGG